MRKRLERKLCQQIMKIPLPGIGFNSLSHYNLVQKFITMPQVLKIPDATAAVDKEWEKLEKLRAWHMTRVRSPPKKKRGHQRGTERRKDSSFSHDNGHLLSQKLGVGTNFFSKKIQTTCCTPR